MAFPKRRKFFVEMLTILLLRTVLRRIDNCIERDIGGELADKLPWHRKFIMCLMCLLE